MSSYKHAFNLTWKGLLSIASIYCIYFQHWVALFIIIPVFFIDIIISKVKTESVATLVKVFLVFQGLIIWYVVSHGFFNSPAATVLDNKFIDSNIADHERLAPQVPGNSLELVLENKSEKSARKPDPNIEEFHENVLNVKLSSFHDQPVNEISSQLLEKVLGTLVATDFPDLKYRTIDEIKEKHPKMFSELPNEFLPEYKNPCWSRTVTSKEAREIQGRRRRGDDPSPSDVAVEGGADGLETQIVCLPYAYVLGQPKCGTSDLYERLKQHQKIKLSKRKEIRWFTRGEFMTTSMSHEGEEVPDPAEGQMRGHKEVLLGATSSLSSFTRNFQELTRYFNIRSSGNEIIPANNDLITIDGGPHTFWWPTQSPDGAFLPEEIPPNQLLHALQPDAKFIITVTDPVARMYSDYYFLDDNLKPLRPGTENHKSPEEFHSRAVSQITMFHTCVNSYLANMKTENKEFLEAFYSAYGSKTGGSGGSGDSNSGGGNSSNSSGNINERIPISDKRHKDFSLWFRASQICAHDRHRFAVGGHGRIAIGLYVLFYEKWLEYFLPNQFFFTKLENYTPDPAHYMQNVFNFLEISEQPNNWEAVLRNVHFNQHKMKRENMLERTRKLLSDFYKPYNTLLAELLNSDEYRFHNLASLPVPEDLEETDTSIVSGPGTGLARSGGANQHVNQHGLHRHIHHDAEEIAAESEAQLALQEAQLNKKNLRGYDSKKDWILTPQSFNISDLPVPKEEKPTTFHIIRPDVENVDMMRSLVEDEPDFAAQQLGISAYGLDLAGIKTLLYDIGMPANAINSKDGGRNAFHAIAVLYTMADAHSKSHVFAMLKGQPSWLTPLLNPPQPLKDSSPLAQDILNALSGNYIDIAKWLLAAGTDPALPDIGGNTPLHHACMGGLDALVEFLVLTAKVDVNLQNKEKKTALHYACAYGHVGIAKLLIDNGADVTIQDHNEVSPHDIISNPGVISSADALNVLGITQRPTKQIERIIHPENNRNDTKFGWIHGTGGWGPERLPGFEDDMDCSVIDQYWADEISGEDIYFKYMARNAPVMIRGLLNDWDVEGMYDQQTLINEHGDLKVQVSDIPYAQKFGGADKVDMTLAEYIEDVKMHRMVGGSHPWYVFKGHQIPTASEGADSLVKYEHFPLPESIKQAFEFGSPPDKRGLSGKKAREMFVNAQWALGGEGTGAPIHFHNTAWSALVYGAKKWVIYPPHSQIMSNKQILDFYETDKQTFEERGIKPVTCVQTAGDVLIIPESWAHGVLNIQESIAIATEFKQSLWRMKPLTNIFSKFPTFDNKDRKMRRGRGDRDPRQQQDPREPARRSEYEMNRRKQQLKEQ